jgi:hypothetical protein
VPVQLAVMLFQPVFLLFGVCCLLLQLRAALSALFVSSSFPSLSRNVEEPAEAGYLSFFMFSVAQQALN